MNRSIRTRLLITFIGVSILPLLAVGVLLALQSLNVQREQARRFQSEVTERVRTQVEAFIDRLDLQLNGAAKELRAGSNDSATAKQILSKLPSYPNVFQELSVVDSSGQETTRLSRLSLVMPDDLKSRALSPEFAAVMKYGQCPSSGEGTYYSPVNFDNDTGEPSMIIAEPLCNPQTGFVDGALIANIRFKEIWDLIARVPVASGESVYISDASGRIVAHVNPSVVLGNKHITLAKDLLGTGLVSTASTTGLNGNTVVMAVNTVEYGSQKFNIIAERDIVQALQLAIQTVAVTVALLVVAIIISSLQAIAVARQLIQPTQVLARAAQSLSEKSEDFDPAILGAVAARKDELGQLARVFQTMGKQVQTREQDLKQQVMELKIEIDEAKKRKAVEEVTGSDMFKELQSRAGEMRRRFKSTSTSSTNLGDASPANA